MPETIVLEPPLILTLDPTMTPRERRIAKDGAGDAVRQVLNSTAPVAVDCVPAD